MSHPFFYLENLLEKGSGKLANWLQSRGRPTIIIGNFDGVHKGHRALFEKAIKLSERPHGGPAAVLSFEPHPRSVFNPERPVFRLSPVDVKRRLLQALSIDGLILIPFDRNFASMSAEAFVCDLLVERLKAAHVVVGYDFHFGKARQGSPDFLLEAGKRYGFAVSVIPPQHHGDGDIIYSSSNVREHLAAGRIEQANEMLGYRYFVRERVIHGEKRGRDLGFPTANMRLGEDNGLKYGIYAVWVRVEGKVHYGVASFGQRPTFDNGAPLLETYLIDFTGDLYGKTVEVAFEAFLRGEEKFDTLDALIRQMNRDTEKALQILKNSQSASGLDEILNRLNVG